MFVHIGASSRYELVGIRLTGSQDLLGEISNRELCRSTMGRTVYKEMKSGAWDKGRGVTYQDSIVRVRVGDFGAILPTTQTRRILTLRV